MSYTIAYIDNGLTIITDHFDNVSTDEILKAHCEKYCNNDSLQNLRYVLTDYSKAKTFSVNPKDIKRIVSVTDEASQLNPNIYAVLVVPDTIEFAVFRMWQSQSVEICPWVVSTVKTREEAENMIEQKKNLQKDLEK